MTDFSFINERVIQDKGFYLFREGVPCDGQVALFDICGVFPGGIGPTHFYAAVYRPMSFNGTTYYERITESAHFDIDPSLLASDSRSSCVGLPVLDIWSVQLGDTIGFTFTDFCTTESLQLGIFNPMIQTVSVCPVYAALTTGNVNDSVYFSPNLTTKSLYISQNELSMMSGVRINIEAIIGK